jgi:hypothetical protein
MQSQLRRGTSAFSFLLRYFIDQKLKRVFEKGLFFSWRAIYFLFMAPRRLLGMFKNWIRLDFKALKWSKWDAVSAHISVFLAFNGE